MSKSESAEYPHSIDPYIFDLIADTFGLDRKGLMVTTARSFGIERQWAIWYIAITAMGADVSGSVAISPDGKEIQCKFECRSVNDDVPVSVGYLSGRFEQK